MRVAADPTRRIHLDGTGPVERPLEVTPELTGWPAPTARAYQYRAGQVVDGESAGDEMVMLLVRGDLVLEAGDEQRRCTRLDPFSDDPVALYLPPGEDYRTLMRADSLVLYCRAPAEGRMPPRIWSRAGGRVLGRDEAEHLRIAEHRLAAGAWARIPHGERAIVYHHFAAPGGWALRPEEGAPPAGAAVIGQGDGAVGRGGEYVVAVAPGAGLLAVVVAAD